MPSAQRSPQPPAIITPSVRKDSGASNALCPKLDKVLGDRCPTLDTTSRNHNALGAQGRRVREADPDSRSASERGESAKREKPREQGRRHLVDNSQVSDKAAGSAEGAGGFERTAFQDAFSSSPREARQRKTGRFFKTLENISFCQTSAVPPSD